MIIYLDTETTGLRPGNICQLSYIIQDKGNVNAKNFFFTVDSVEPSASIVHGFTVEILKELSNGRRFSDDILEIERDFDRADVIVSHNTAFDFMFLSGEFERCNRVFAPLRSFCTMKNTVSACKIPRFHSAGYKYPKMVELCAFLHIAEWQIEDEADRLFGGSSGYHDARFDTTAVYLAVNRGVDVIPSMSNLKEFL